MLRSLFIYFLLFASCILAFSGTQPTSDSFNTDAVTSITIGVFGDIESAFTAIFSSEDFKAKFPNVTIELQPTDFGGHHNRLVTQLAAGTGANDIEALDIGYLARFAADGGLTDLAKAPFNGQNAGMNLAKFAMSNATMASGKLLAMPLDVSPAVLFYRKSICDAAGVDMSQIADWYEYIEIAQKLTVDFDNDGSFDQFALTHPVDASMIPLNGGKGDWFSSGEPYTPKNRFLEPLELVRDMRQSGIDANFTPWSGEWINSFKEGVVVTMFSGHWLGGHFKNWMCPELSGDWRVAYPPGKTCASYGGSYLSIPEQTADEKKQTAWKIIEYLCASPEAQLLMFRTTDAFPALTSIYTDPVMDEPVEYFGGQKVRKIYCDIVLNIPVQKTSEYDSIAVDIYNKAIYSVVNGELSVGEAYEEAKKEMLAQM